MQFFNTVLLKYINLLGNSNIYAWGHQGHRTTGLIGFFADWNTLSSSGHVDISSKVKFPKI
ncbi:hypothetical protein QMN03_13230, partial [Leptospira santarosai]|nr:hypothetical protein [Leptospira santarosai]